MRSSTIRVIGLWERHADMGSVGLAGDELTRRVPVPELSARLDAMHCGRWRGGTHD